MIKSNLLSKKEIEREARRNLKALDIRWSKMIKERAFNKCEICGSTKQLNSHHIIPSEFKPSRHDLMNGICLCILHHKFSLEISPHRNSFVFYLWLKQNRSFTLSHLELHYGNSRIREIIGNQIG